MKHRNALAMTWCVGMAALLSVGPLHAQKDPGPRGGPASTGGPYQGLSDSEKSFFGGAMMHFMEVDSVSGTIEDGSGLGPTFNGNSCAQCHAQPTVGGSSPGLSSPQNPIPNPQVALATLDGATNTVPPFITADGPVREARFIRNHDGSLDGGVHGLYTIAGRTDAPGCTLAQPNFAGQLAARNVIFRTPTPLFGLGLVENTPDAALQANLAANQGLKRSLGIGGRFNISGNDGTITRFGWKAQNKSLLMFAAEAYNVEQGVANELFSNERSAVPGCVFNGTPEDDTNIGSTGAVSDVSSDIVDQAAFARLSAPPTPAPMSPSAQNGSQLFDSVGCVLCHSSSLTTGKAPYTGMSNVEYHPYSDFALHHMGSTLADGVNQGVAGADEFRTAPLWGIGQRLYFLHDGRTSDMLAAIEDHASPAGCGGNLRWGSHNRTQSCGSEANGVIRRFNALSASQKQDILNFLRSL
jgi:hypothetical protein